MTASASDVPAALALFDAAITWEILEEVEISEPTRFLERAFEVGHWPANGRASGNKAPS
jgi:hypothetical protein